MDYEKKYKEALKRARTIVENKDASSVWKDWLCNTFPELAESEDDRIKNWLIGYFHQYKEDGMEKYANGLNVESIIAWLEKQGEIDNCPLESSTNTVITDSKKNQVEPKFKADDWINGYYTNYKVLSVNNEGYVVEDVDGNKINILFENEKFHHLWTIRDAKDGDVLYHKAENGIEYIVMNKGLNEFNNIDSYFRYNSIDGFNTDIPSVLSAKCDSITPATKEQRDLLFQKMIEAGYEWDEENKELKKIEQKPADKIEPFDKYEGLTDFERTLADICIGWIGKELGWKQYIKDNADVLLKIAVEKFNSVQDVPFEQKLAWNEEDKKMCQETIDWFEKKCFPYALESENPARESIKWLKSLKDRCTWKPSEEQMKALHDLNLTGNISYTGQGQVLIELYNDLKKL